MYRHQNLLAIIPARSGSKGIPRKNIKSLKGKPLIAHSIASACHSTHLDRCMLSTDDEEIATIAREYNAEVPFRRPEQLALDETPSIEVVRNLLDRLQNEQQYEPDYIMMLQPTSPLRTSEDIDRAIEKLLSDEESASLLSVKSVEEHPDWMYHIQQNQLIPYHKQPEEAADRRQDLDTLYYPNGAIYLCRTKDLREEHTLTPDPILPYVMPPERSVDIDDEFDWKLTEFLMESGDQFRPSELNK